MVISKAQISDFSGYKKYDFKIDGREVIVVEPKVLDENRRWVWRAEFFNAFPSVDNDLLSKGFYIVYYKISDMFGSMQAIELMEQFRKYITQKFNLAPSAAIFGFSRGGLYAFNYAAAYPEGTAVLYLDAPVLDLLSWPAGYGNGEGSPDDWTICKYIYGLNDENAKFFKNSPLNKIEKVIKNKIPIILVAGDSDKTVPYKENGEILVNECRKCGAKINVIIKPDCGHHPHSLNDPAPVTQFILDNYRE